MNKREYTPSKKILERYATVMVNFAAGKGKGVKKGDVVRISGKESAKPLFMAVVDAVIDAGGYPILSYMPEECNRLGSPHSLMKRGSHAQLCFTPAKLYAGVVDQIDHEIIILSENNKSWIAEIPPENLRKINEATVGVYLRDIRNRKEINGDLSWTLCLYGTDEMAREAGLSISQYWNQIKKACFLDFEDPIAEWKKSYKEIDRIRKKLTSMKIESLHVIADDVDLKVKIGKDRKWLAGRGANIPSFEIFTSPDWRGTEGTIAFNQPLYYSGSVIRDIKLEFKRGKIVSFDASSGKDVLASMIKTTHASKVGEFSLTDRRHSNITKPMAETLFDENMGGKYGNTHIALGMAYKEAYDGELKGRDKEFWKGRGFNDSKVHTDIISTTDRTVTATLADGSERIIYNKGEFII